MESLRIYDTDVENSAVKHENGINWVRLNET